MSNDVVIRVRVRQDARDGFAAVGREAEAEGHKAGEKFTTRFGGIMTRMGQLLQEPVRRAAQSMGEQMGEHGGKSFVQRLSTIVTSSTSKLTEIGRNIGQAVGGSVSREVSESVVRGAREGSTRVSGGRGGSSTSRGGAGGAGGSSTSRSRSGGAGGRGGDADVDVDVDRQSLLSRLLALGKDGATSFWQGFSGGLSNFFSGDLISLLVKSLAITTLIPFIAAPISAAVVAAVELALGGGIIAAGVIAAFQDPKIKGAAKELGGDLKAIFADFGKPFRGPVMDFLERLARDIMPKLKVYSGVLSDIFAPLTQQLGQGLIGFIQNMLPGLVDGLKGAAPIIKVLADRLPDIGQALGDFFREMGQHGDDAAVFFNDLISFVIKTIDIVGKLIGWFADLYSTVSRVVRGAVRLARDLYNAWKDGLELVIGFILEFAHKVIGWFGRILNAAVLSMGWIPGVGGKLRGAQAQFSEFRKNVNSELGKIKDKTVTIRMRTFGLAGANAAVSVAEQLAALGYASGGIAGMLPQIGQAASGGVRNGLTLVGEQGPELVDLPAGARVWSNGDSNRMAGDSSDSFVATAQFLGSADQMVNAIMDRIQIRVARRYGGNVQTALGRG